MDPVKLNTILSRRVAASTLVEVTTALVIISMIFGFSILIYLNIQKNGLSSYKTTAAIRVENLYAEGAGNGRYDDREIDYEDMIISQKVEKQMAEDLVMVRIEAYNRDGKLIVERKFLVYAPPVIP